MEHLRLRLMESGVIGHVLHDFNPHLELKVSYGNKRISLGDHVNPYEVQDPPTGFQNYYDVRDLWIQQMFTDPKLVVLIMTDPYAPGGEYLKWLSVSYMSTHYDIDMPRTDIVAYEPPRAGAHMLVLTLFKIHEFQPINPPNSRENFSTMIYARNNSLALPVTASFFNVWYVNEDNAQENWHGESPTCNVVSSYRKCQENGSFKNGDDDESSIYTSSWKTFKKDYVETPLSHRNSQA